METVELKVDEKPRIFALEISSKETDIFKKDFSTWDVQK